jgi:hypothetical protein
MNIGVDFSHPLRELFGRLQIAEIANDDALQLGTDCCDLIALWPGYRDFIHYHGANHGMALTKLLDLHRTGSLVTRPHFSGAPS